MKKATSPTLPANGARLAPTTPTLLVALGIHLLGLTATATVAPKDMDLAFGTGGQMTFEPGEIWDSVIALAGGEFLAMSYGYQSGTSISKFTKDGTPSAAFGIGGRVRFSVGRLVAVRPDGKIIAAGSEQYTLNSVKRVRITVTRLLSNGNPDTSFGGDGSVEFDNTEYDMPSVASMGFANDGKILLGGEVRQNDTNKPAIIRLTPDGYLDTSFSGDGIALFYAGDGTGGVCTRLVPLPDGSIMAAGSGNQVWRALPDGNLDPSFGSGGRVLLDFYTFSGFHVRPNGKLIVSGYKDANINCFLVSLNSNGSVDTSFGTGGTVEIDAGAGVKAYPNSSSMMPDGRILVAGAVNEASGRRFLIFRLMPDGSPDPSFGSGYTMQDPGTGSFDSAFARDMAIDSAGRILVIGNYYYQSGYLKGLLIRLKGDPDTDGDGIVDASEDNSGTYVSAFNTGSNPSNPDTDGDGIPDGSEVYRYGSNPNLPDTDGDGFLDGYEVQTGFDPTSATSTPDALSSMRTAVEFRFSAASGVSYRIEGSTDLNEWSTVEEGITGTGGVITRFYSIENIPQRYFRAMKN